MLLKWFVSLGNIHYECGAANLDLFNNANGLPVLYWKNIAICKQ